MVFRELIREKVVTVYMDDLIVTGKDEIENLNKVKTILEVAEHFGLVIRFDKCQFVKKRVTFLGHVLEKGTIKPSDEKTKAIRLFPTPTSVKHVQSFLGLAGFFRKFVPGFSIIAKPLTDLTRKNAVFVFKIEQKNAFDTLKELLCAALVLKIYDADAETELHTDASKVGYGACLLQKCEGEWHPVFYLSHMTTPAEANYASYDLEVLAIIIALQTLKVYLLGLQFKIVTDCRAFNQTMTKRDLCTKVARCSN